MSPETAIAASHRATQLENVLRKVIRGKDDIVRLALVSVLARGHLLIEDIPGVGRFSILIDPQGAAFAIIKTSMPPS